MKLYCKRLHFEVLEYNQVMALPLYSSISSNVATTLVKFAAFLDNHLEHPRPHEDLLEMALMLIEQLVEIRKLKFYPLWLRIVSDEVDFRGYTLFNVINEKALLDQLRVAFDYRVYPSHWMYWVFSLEKHPRCAEALKLLEG